MTPFQIYIWRQASNVVCVFSLIAIATAIAIIFMVPFWDEYKGVRKWCVIVFVTSSLIAMFSPSSNTIAIMYVIPRIAESKAIQTDLPELYGLAVKQLKESLKK